MNEAPYMLAAQPSALIRVKPPARRNPEPNGTKEGGCLGSALARMRIPQLAVPLSFRFENIRVNSLARRSPDPLGRRRVSIFHSIKDLYCEKLLLVILTYSHIFSHILGYSHVFSLIRKKYSHDPSVESAFDITKVSRCKKTLPASPGQGGLKVIKTN